MYRASDRMYDREDLLVKVATMFFEHNITQTEIARELGISRPTIATLLNEAKEKKVVQIIISHPNKHLLYKENQLHNLFPDTEIIIATQTNGSSKESVGLAAANLLKSLFQSVNSVGLGWGTTLSEVVTAFDFKDFNHLTFQPLIGGIAASEAQYHSNHLVSSLASKVNGKAEYLYAPALADNVIIKKTFEDNSLIKNSLSMAKKVDLAIVGLGNPIVNSNFQEHGYLSTHEIKELIAKDVVGDVLTTFFNSDGNVIETNISERMIGLGIEDLKNIKQVVAVSAGKEKAVFTLLTLEKKLIDYLIIDEGLADSILDIVKQEKDESVKI